MGSRLQDHYEQSRAAAIDIAVAAGCIKHCERHYGNLIVGSKPNSGAYKLGNRLFTSGQLSDTFPDRVSMTDEIQAVMELAMPCCYECEEPE